MNLQLTADDIRKAIKQYLARMNLEMKSCEFEFDFVSCDESFFGCACDVKEKETQ